MYAQDLHPDYIYSAGFDKEVSLQGKWNKKFSIKVDDRTRKIERDKKRWDITTEGVLGM